MSTGAKERKSHMTTVLPNELLDELDTYSRIEKVTKAFVVETALIRFFASEKAKRKAS
jgi:hypothetical protein